MLYWTVQGTIYFIESENDNNQSEISQFKQENQRFISTNTMVGAESLGDGQSIMEAQ
jgi:hypothetical protein